MTLASFFVLFFPGIGGANGLGYTGDLAAKEDSAGNILQTRSHNASLALGQSLTNALSLTEHLRYNNEWQERGKKTEHVSQNAQLVDLNAFFQANLAGSTRLVIEDDRDGVETKNIEAAISSTWEYELAPTLSLVVGRHTAHDNFVNARPDAENSTMNTVVEWENSFLAAYYSYRTLEQDTGQGLLVQTTDFHDASLKFNKAYWDQKFTVRFQQSYSQSRRLVEQISPDAGAVLPLTVSEIHTGLDTTPADFSEDPLVVANPQMADTDLVTPAYSVLNATSDNVIRLRLNGNTVDRIHLYTPNDLGVLPAGLTWRLYTNDDLLTPWADGGNLSPTYNSSRQRFEINLGPLAAEYIKLVLDISLLGPASLNFSGVQVFNSNLTTSIGSVTEISSQSTALFLDARLSQNWALSYLFDFGVNEGTGSQKFNVAKLGQAVNLSYKSVDGTILSRISMSQQNEESGLAHSPESQGRNYSFGLDKALLPTLNVGIGAGKNERYLSAVLISETASYHIDCDAQLYPDLGMGLAFNYAESAYSPIQTVGVKNESKQIDFTVTSRLRPEVALTLSESYLDQKNATQSLESFNTGISLNWQLSTSLIISGSGHHTVDNTPKPAAYGITSGINMALARGLLFRIQYAASKSDETMQSGAANLNWSAKRGLRCEGGLSYTQSTGPQAIDDFLVSARVTLSFKVP
jgi:hypothetical protein